jgi:hypothetical protein
MVAANFPTRHQDSNPDDWTSVDPDRAAARVLADEYAALHSMPSIKIMELVDRCWRQHADGDRRQLAQALLGILAPLDAGAEVTREIRILCERAVIQWKERIRARTYQSA